MGGNSISRFFQTLKDANRISRTMPKLVKAVNKIYGAAGIVNVSDARERVSYDKNFAIPSQTLESCADALEELAPRIKMQRLKNVPVGTQKKEPQPAHPIPSENDNLAQAIIQLRDQMLYFKSGAAGDAIKVLDSLYQQTGRLLSKNGIVPIEDSGVINPERHKVLSVKITRDVLLKNTIAETIQPGYIIGGELFRPQEVIIYKPEE